MIRKIYTRLMAVLSLALVLTACSDDAFLQDGKVAGSGEDAFWAQYDFVLAEDDDASTRVAYESDKRSVFEEGDEIGVYAVDDDGNLVDKEPNSNVRYEVRSVTNLTTNKTRQVLIPVDPNARVKRDCPHYVLYYPYNPNMTLNRLKAYTHTVAQDQGAEGAYEASDLLWSYYTPEGNLYTIAFDHAMAQIVIELGGIYVPTENRESAVKLLNMPTQATDINLVQPLDENFTYNPVFSSGTEDADRMISTWLFEAGSTEDRLQYRACVPAHEIEEGSPVVRVYYDATNYREYKIPSGLDLKPGYKYTFTLSKGAITEIDINDDDSWVLDVLDPKTQEPVGLLCREYLRYQPDGISQEYNSGDVTNAPANQCWLNSQAWVFYNLKDYQKRIPDLDKGTVLRFIYDVEYHGYDLGYFPAPHDHYQQQGIFTPEHGYHWGEKNAEGYGQEIQNSFEEHYMNGGTVTWDGANNKISSFVKLPESERITCDEAKKGFIAITGDGDNISAKVSYGSLTEPGVRVGIIVPHNLVDTREVRNEDGTTTQETNLYPLVKIGYNQFWMSKPLRAKSLIDGTPLTCYNKIGKDKPAALDIVSTQTLDAGYIYPFTKDLPSGANGATMTYDPINDPAERDVTEYPDVTYRPSPLYNKLTTQDEKFVPASDKPNRYYYMMPTGNEVESMISYIGNYFAAKMASREIATKQPTQLDDTNEYFAYWKYEAAVKGQTHDNGGTAANYYAANISGFNLHATGYYFPGDDNIGSFMEITGGACFMVKTQGDHVECFRIPVYGPFDDNATLSHVHLMDATYSDDKNKNSKFFAQVRMMMKFNNQADNGGSTNSLSSSRAATRASGKSQQSRNVRVQLVP